VEIERLRGLSMLNITRKEFYKRLRRVEGLEKRVIELKKGVMN
jgi:hypothetical protein